MVVGANPPNQPPAQPAQPNTHALEGAFSALRKLQESISNIIKQQTSALNDSITFFASNPFTPSVSGGVQFGYGNVSYSASGGIVASLNLRTGDYVLPTGFVTKSPEVSTPSLSPIHFNLSFNLGFGDISGFAGEAKSATTGPFSYSYNSNFTQLGLTASFDLKGLDLSGASFSERSETVLEPFQRANVLSDIQSIERTLWGLSQDPLSGNLR